MELHPAASLSVALVFAAIHLGGGFFKFLSGTPRSVWLSVAGGVSVAYVFIHVLPELAAHQRELPETLWAGGPEVHVYVVALLGLVLFYGLDTLLRRSAGERSSDGVFWTHLGSFALYNLLLGYLLVHREDPSLIGLFLFAFAIGLHFIVNDQSLREHHGQVYHDRGRWLLAMAPLAGWAAGVATEIDSVWLTAIFALLAGSIVLNVLKEELPPDRESRFSAFAAGAAGYAALLLLVE